MNEFILAQLVEHLLPLFPGAEIISSNAKAPKRFRSYISLVEPTKIAIQIERKDKTRIIIARSQPFSPGERRLIELFIEELKKVERFSYTEYREQLVDAALRICISKYIDNQHYLIISETINQLESLAGRTYEGNNLSLGVGIVNKQNRSDITNKELYENDFGLVVSNGLHTIITINYEGYINGQEDLNNYENNSCTPVAYIPIANWSEGKIAFALNRNGEVLIFRNKQLAFSKRRRRWQFYSHENAIKILAAKNRTCWASRLRESVYESMLDVSFSRKGGLIALIKRPYQQQVTQVMLKKDISGTGATAKSKYLKHVFKKVSFPDIPRRIRQEIIAIDGATVISYLGEIINAGAIITNIKPMEDGGARTAAANTLAEYGVALKISMDGKVKGFARKNTEKTIYQYLTYG